MSKSYEPSIARQGKVATDRMKDTASLLQHLEVQPKGKWLFEGNSVDIGGPSVYGGQVLAQSLNAAYKTVGSARLAHSIHAYFFLRGDFDLPVTYQVEAIRDGRSFTTRDVKALQNEKVIFQCIISFQVREERFYDHQVRKPRLFRTPRLLMSNLDYYQMFKKFFPPKLQEWLSYDRPIEFKPVEVERFLFPQFRYRPNRHIWFRFLKTIPVSQPQAQQMLLYASDYNLLFTSLDPHRHATTSNVQAASIDHAMWFHRDIDISDWLLYQLDSPSSSNARGFTRGNIFSRKGVLIASTVQEGLIRPLRKSDKAKSDEQRIAPEPQRGSTS
jgi:acyl-CoA thioesterase II